MKTQPEHSSRTDSRQAFTLLELIVAIVILTIAMSIAYEAFTGTIRGWKRGTEVADGIRHGDFAMNQLVVALNSTIYFNNPRKSYAFKVEKKTGYGLPADSISFVTASGAFMPANSPYAKGPHRLKLSIGDDDHGDPALFALPMPAIADDEEYANEFGADAILAAREIAGLEILFWDSESELWTEEWEQENAVPERILINVFIASEEENEDPIMFTRAIEIPVFDSVKERLRQTTRTGGSSP